MYILAFRLQGSNSLCCYRSRNSRLQAVLSLEDLEALYSLNLRLVAHSLECLLSWLASLQLCPLLVPRWLQEICCLFEVSFYSQTKKRKKEKKVAKQWGQNKWSNGLSEKKRVWLLFLKHWLLPRFLLSELWISHPQLCHSYLGNVKRNLVSQMSISVYV